MIGAGSLQLRKFRRAIRDGASLEEACLASGTLENGEPIIGLAEGRIILAQDEKNPPPPEAFEVPEQAPRKETAMAEAAKKEDGEGAGIHGEYKRPDAAKAFEIYDKQIKPKLTKIETARGELSQPWQDIKEHAHFPRPVMNFLIMLENIDDDAKRDHFLLALSGGLQHRKLFLPRDLVTMADGQDGAEIVQFGDRQRPQLATLQMGVPSDGTETDLADAGEFEEASEEELAAQEGRPSNDAGDDEPEAEAAE